MPLNVTEEEPGWIRLRADASDLLKDTQALKVYTAVRDLVATKDPKVIAMLCVAFLFALDGHKLAKFPDESRVWYVVAETQYTLAVTGLEEPADPPSDTPVGTIKEGLEVTDAKSDAVWAELEVQEEGGSAKKENGKGTATITTTKQLGAMATRNNASASPRGAVTRSGRYKPGPKLYSPRSKEAPSLPAKKRKAEKQTTGKDEKQRATDDNCILLISIG